MGNLKSCMTGASGQITGGMKEASAEEKKFDALVKAIEIPEGDKSTWIYFRYTQLPSVDKVIYDAQVTVNDLHKVRSALIKGIQKIVARTAIWHIPGSNTSHALMSLIYAMASQTQGVGSDKFLTFGGKFPWVKLGKDSAPVNIAKDTKMLADYLQALESAYSKMPKILEDCVELAKKAASLQDDAKDDLERISKLSLPKATKALTHNIKMLGRTKNLAKVTMGLVTKTAKELEHACQVLKEENSSLPEFGKTLADEGIVAPRECYERVGKKIDTSAKPQTEEQMLSFPYDQAGGEDEDASKSTDQKDEEE